MPSFANSTTPFGHQRSENMANAPLKGVLTWVYTEVSSPVAVWRCLAMGVFVQIHPELYKELFSYTGHHIFLEEASYRIALWCRKRADSEGCAGRPWISRWKRPPARGADDGAVRGRDGECLSHADLGSRACSVLRSASYRFAKGLSRTGRFRCRPPTAQRFLRNVYSRCLLSFLPWIADRRAKTNPCSWTYRSSALHRRNNIRNDLLVFTLSCGAKGRNRWGVQSTVASSSLYIELLGLRSSVVVSCTISTTA